jgi:hypothetical protein
MEFFTKVFVSNLVLYTSHTTLYEIHSSLFLRQNTKQIKCIGYVHLTMTILNTLSF